MFRAQVPNASSATNLLEVCRVKARTRNLLRQLRTIVLVLVVICILWRLWRGVNWSEVRRSLAQANAFALALAMIASGGINLVRAFRWRALLSPLIQADIHDLFVATNTGIGGSFLFGGAVGELIRPLTLTLLNRRVRPSVSLLTVMVERLFDLSVLCIFFALTLLWLPVLGTYAIRVEHIRILGVILLVLPAVGVGIMIFIKRRFVLLPGGVAPDLAAELPLASSIRRRAVRFFYQLMNAVSLLSSKREFTRVTFWTAALWLLNLLTNWLTIRAFGLSLGPKGILLVVCCGLLGSLVPTPGGAAGAFHLAISSGLIFLGVTLERAAAISITAHLVGFVPALVFCSYYLLRGSVNLAQLRLEVSDVTRQGVDRWRR
jgi:uncharacterized protein (TIRG00374 family)